MTFTVFDASQVPGAQISILDNGGFEIWQRGTSFTHSSTNASGYTQVYDTDRWKSSLYTGATGSLTVTVSQNSSVVQSGQYSLECNITTSTGSNYFTLVQFIENYQAYQGKTLTLSIWINTTRTDINLEMYDGFTGSVSSYHPGDGTWHQLTLTKTISSSATSLQILVGQNGTPVAATGAYYVDSAMLVVGSQPANFVALHPQVDLARCQRYYEYLSGSNGQQCIGTICGNGSYAAMVWPFKQTKRIQPTITYGTISVSVYFVGTVANSGVQSSQGDSSVWGFVVQLNSTETVGNAVVLLSGSSITASADL